MSARQFRHAHCLEARGHAHHVAVGAAWRQDRAAGDRVPVAFVHSIELVAMARDLGELSVVDYVPRKVADKGRRRSRRSAGEPLALIPQPLGGLGFFGSGAEVQFTPSIVFRRALASADVAPSSPSPPSSSRIAGMRGSASSGLIVRRMRSLAGTVAMT